MPAAGSHSPFTPAAFEDAREVFRLAHAALIEAQRFFVLNGFVTDHVAILTAQAACYKYVSVGGGPVCCGW